MEPRATRVDLLEERITHSIIQSFYDVYNHYGFGLLESVYANALAIDLRSKGHKVEREVWIVIYYKGERASRQRLDMVVDDKVVVETKAREN